ncbi:GNAT family N-acetyltransferase [Mesorhizobium sp.]|uniref:GNAT family N-acetyltransferase n=1 Tax=Mesorhizobium sp. TaxID=1871066 RepID=UPI0011FC8A2B|nr:GNAT family N-acetyltransferase [Mesorhizobium sp.]TIS33930.1 MAG: GNAT family N-acetyltransferase [Mesorhizobium sp.]
MTTDTAIAPDGPELGISMKTLELTRENWDALARHNGNVGLLLHLRHPPLHFYRYLVDRIGRKWHWQDYLCLSDADLTARIHGPQRDMRLLMIEGAPAGFFDLDRRDKETVEVVYFGLMEHVAGRGFGRWLFSEAMAAAFSADARRIVLKTCSLDHPAALAIYQKAGFQIVADVPMTMRLLTLDQRGEILLR